MHMYNGNPTMFTDLPYEIQFAIGLLLSSHNFTACIIVCRTWRKIFTPSLWRHIGASPSWSMHQQAWQDAFDTSVNQGCLTRYGHFIRSIDLTLNPFRLKDFLANCPATFPQLTSASLKCIAQDDEAVADFIGRCSPTKGWKSLSFDGTGASLYFGKSSAKALLKHAATLESLSLVPGFRFPSKSIHELLCSAPRLKKLNLVSPLQKRGRNVDGRLDARDIVASFSSGWVCTSLEVFRCHIGHIPRPDISWVFDEEPASEFIPVTASEIEFLVPPSKFVTTTARRESLILQRGVYAQLARMTRLRELWLGLPLWRSRLSRGSLCEIVRPSNESWIYDSLAMTLEGGLDLLKDLKELKVVGLKGMEMDDFCNVAEQQWVVENWPDVHLSGLEVD